MPSLDETLEHKMKMKKKEWKKKLEDYHQRHSLQKNRLLSFFLKHFQMKLME